MGAYFSLISQPRQSLGGRLWHDVTQGPWLASQLCRMHCRQSLHPRLWLPWQEGRDSPGRGRSYFCNLRHPDLVTVTPSYPRVSKMQLELSNLSKTRRVRTGCQPTQSTSGPVPDPAEHTPSQGGRCPRRAALGQSCGVSAPPDLRPQPGSSAVLTSPSTGTNQVQELCGLLIWASQVAH